MPRLAEHLTRPLVAAGNRLTGFAQRDGRPAGPASSLLLGVATGLRQGAARAPDPAPVLATAAAAPASARRCCWSRMPPARQRRSASRS